MRKFALAATCLAAVALLGACNKNADDKCCNGKDTAAVKMDASGTPASDAKKCCGQCKNKAAVKMDASATPASDAKSCGSKSSCADKAGCAGKSAN